MGEDVEGANAQQREVENLAKEKGAEPRSRGTDLTGIFRQVDVREAAPPPQAPVPSNAQGGATDLFSTVNAERASEDRGFTQMFESLGAAGPSGNAPPQKPLSQKPLPPWKEPVREEAQRGEPGQPSSGRSPGEFTRLFERLDAPRPHEAATPQPRYEPAPAATPAPGGGFTQLLRTLSSESSAELPNAASPPEARSMVQPAPEGPGEFTRIVSRSALREATHRDASGGAQQPSEPSAAARSEPQSAPVGSVLSNAQSLSSVAGSGMAAASIGSAGMAGASAVRQLASVAAAPLAGGAMQPQPGGKLQAYLPLLLIANLFAMLILILLVAFVLLRHH